MESFFETPKSVQCTEMPGTRARSCMRSATSEILKFGFLSMKELLYMPKSDLFEYKWANLESFFETPKSVRCTEMPGMPPGIIYNIGNSIKQSTNLLQIRLPQQVIVLPVVLHHLHQLLVRCLGSRDTVSVEVCSQGKGSLR